MSTFGPSLRRAAACVALFMAFIAPSRADRIYIMLASGYDACDAPLSSVMTSLGHTVVLSPLNATTLPAGFVCTSADPVNGYDWLCFFGSLDRTSLTPAIQTFVNAGGKVYLQYEVTCCTVSSASAATILSALSGLTITPNVNDYIALSGLSNVPGWGAVSPDGCLNAQGSAYKGMDGVPVANQLNATVTLGSANPSITTCDNFGFVFRPADLPGGNGGVVGIGDVNIWYNSAGEPPNNGGTEPVDTALVLFVFPVNDEGCGLLPTGPLVNTTAVAEVVASPLVTVRSDASSGLLQLDVNATGRIEILVTNAMGQEIARTSGTTGRMTIGTSSLPHGCYQVMASTTARTQVVRFVVQ